MRVIKIKLQSTKILILYCNTIQNVFIQACLKRYSNDKENGLQHISLWFHSQGHALWNSGFFFFFKRRYSRCSQAVQNSHSVIQSKNKKSVSNPNTTLFVWVLYSWFKFILIGLNLLLDKSWCTVFVFGSIYIALFLERILNDFFLPSNSFFNILIGV